MSFRQEDQTRINANIREKEVRLIDHEGNNVGVVPTGKALEMAEEAGLDLVEVATGAAPHVCKIMDYGHYKFEQAKRQKEAKKKQKVIVVKEIKMRPRTDEHDYEFKVNHARDFLEQGCKVKFTIMYRGRELAYKDRGRSVLDRIEEDLKDIAVVEAKPRFEGRTMHMVMTPSNKPKPKKKPEDQPEKQEIET
jgi:translation initiation factor IF-3